MTVTLPSGRKLRTTTRRRFVLVADAPEREPFIVKRSDAAATLKAYDRTMRGKGYFSERVIVDMTTGEAVR